MYSDEPLILQHIFKRSINRFRLVIVQFLYLFVILYSFSAELSRIFFRRNTSTSSETTSSSRFHPTTSLTPKINTALLTNNWNNLITQCRHPFEFWRKKKGPKRSEYEQCLLSPCSLAGGRKTVVHCIWKQRTPLLIWRMPQVNSLIKNVCSAAQRTD